MSGKECGREVSYKDTSGNVLECLEKSMGVRYPTRIHHITPGGYFPPKERRLTPMRRIPPSERISKEIEKLIENLSVGGDNQEILGKLLELGMRKVIQELLEQEIEEYLRCALGTVLEILTFSPQRRQDDYFSKGILRHHTS